MTNIKKIGLSALAGALAMTTAHAGSVSLSGSMEVTYTKGSGYQDTGNPLGQENELTVKGATELDNGVTVAYKQSITNDNARNDSELVFGNILGGGTIAVTSTGGPISAIDDVTPTAFEEANAQVGSITDVNGSDGTWGIRYTLADVAGSGIKFDYMYYPVHGAGDANGDQAPTGGVPGNKDAYEVTLTGSVPGVDGLSLGVGYAELNYDIAAPNNTEKVEGTAYAKYAYGPLSLGYQIGHTTLSGLGNTTYKNEYYGISYAVSDNLSVSYNRIDSLIGQHTFSYLGGRDQSFDSISLSYSMGGMTIGIADADCSNCSYTANRKQDETTVSLSVAF
jgi:outer membrane protein OmpU